MRDHLKVKIAGLAAEQTAMKRLERKRLKHMRRIRSNAAKVGVTLDKVEGWDNRVSAWESIRRHRTIDVRREARACYLALGFLRGLEYHRIETLPIDPDKGRSAIPPDWSRVQYNVERFTDEDKRVVAQRLEQWIQTAKAFRKEIGVNT